MPRPVPAEVQDQIERCHGDVLEGEAALLAAKRRPSMRAPGSRKTLERG